MYWSLYSKLKSLVNDKATGVLSANHKYGEQGKIFLRAGEIINCEIGELNGVDAAKILAKWLSFNAKFAENEPVPDNDSAKFNTKDFLTYLGKIDTWAHKFQKVIPQNSARFKIHLNGLKKEINLKPTQLRIALALDGKRTVTQLVSELKISEFKVLNTIFYFNELGIAEVAGINRPMEEAQRASFLNSLKDILFELIGPAAEVVIDDAFESIKSGEEFLARNEIPNLITAITTHLDMDEETVFLEWWKNQSSWK